jgi:hypothetical protein
MKRIPSFLFTTIMLLLSQRLIADNSFEQKIDILRKELEQNRQDIKNLADQKNLNFKKIQELNDERKYSAVLYEQHSKIRKEKEAKDRKTKEDLELKLADAMSKRDRRIKDDHAQQKQDALLQMELSTKQLENSRKQLENEKIKKRINREDEYIDKELKRSDAVTNVVNAGGEALRNESQGKKSMMEGIGKGFENLGKHQ